MPALLLATESAIQVEVTSSIVADIPSGDMLLLAEPAIVRNLGQQPATFVVARSVPTESATTHPADQTRLDPALSDAWHHYGCHLKRSISTDEREGAEALTGAGRQPSRVGVGSPTRATLCRRACAVCCAIVGIVASPLTRIPPSL